MTHGALCGEGLAGPKLTSGHGEPFSLSYCILRATSEFKGEEREESETERSRKADLRGRGR